jgi:hypothetical protein
MTGLLLLVAVSLAAGLALGEILWRTWGDY